MSALSTPVPSKSHESEKLMLAAIVILLYLLVIIFDFLPLQKNQAKKETVIYCAMLSVSFIILLLYSLGIITPGLFETVTRFSKMLLMPVK